MSEQEEVVTDLVAQGFMVVERNQSIVRLTKGADARLVRKDGTQKRANHVIVRGKP